MILVDNKLKKISKRVLGVDPGAVRVGLAVSDITGLVVRPLMILDRKKPKPAERVVEVAHREDCGVIVVGLPLNQDGSEGESALKARWFFGKICEAVGDRSIEAYLWDERFTSRDALELQRESGAVNRTNGVVDDWAAALILRDWIDHHSVDGLF